MIYTADSAKRGTVVESSKATTRSFSNAVIDPSKIGLMPSICSAFLRIKVTARAGAAFALLKGADVVDPERLLNTAKSAVAPGLDAAFEAIANETSDEALANALAAVEEPALEAR
jgi:hypothetical protein